MDGILVLDVGSSSTRALVFDEQANVVEGLTTRRPTQFVVTPDGGSEDDAPNAYERVAGCLDDLQKLMRGRDIHLRAAGISSYACSLLCLDEQSEPLTPVFTYADTRSAGDAKALRDDVDELQTLQRTGCRIRANYVPGRIVWLRRTRPDVFARTRRFASLSDYLALRLLGTDRGGLSVWSWSGLVNRASRDWDAAWLNKLGITAQQLPVLAGPDEWLGRLRSELTERWPMLRDVPWMPAYGDGAVANVGSGCTDSRRVAVTIGTTAALRIVRPTTVTSPQRERPSPQPSPGTPGEGARAPSPVTTGEGGGGGQGRAPSRDVKGAEVQLLPHGLWGYRVDAGRELIGGATTEGGNVFAWLSQTLKLPPAAELEKVMAQLPPDAQGLTILPLFAGERSPGYSEHSRATLSDLTFDVTPVVLARACLEAVAYRLGMIYDDLRQLAQPDAGLVASGGALLASPTWCQIVADVTGTALSVCEEPEATARGVALLALERLGAIRSVSDLPVRLGVTYQPDAQRHAVYRSAMERQQKLYANVVM